MTETFLLYGILDTSTGELVSNITNPRHSYRVHNGVRDKENLKVVEIKCEVQE